jgi:peptide deformylase
VLKSPSCEVKEIDNQVRRFIDDLIETMRHYPRCVGLAAPQVGNNIKVAVVDVTGHPKASGKGGLIILINPKIVEAEDFKVQREGCLSVPDFTGNVARAGKIEVQSLDSAGKKWSGRFLDFEAIAIQHEIDHLEGKLFLDRVQNIRQDVFKRKKYWFPQA